MFGVVQPPLGLAFISPDKLFCIMLVLLGVILSRMNGLCRGETRPRFPDKATTTPKHGEERQASMMGKNEQYLLPSTMKNVTMVQRFL